MATWRPLPWHFYGLEDGCDFAFTVDLRVWFWLISFAFCCSCGRVVTKLNSLKIKLQAIGLFDVCCFLSIFSYFVI
uniref:Uncharacterized protein n=1 Tax=Rhizophora mucronata TaxID=61149 RepID=A0A2P2MY52_RHIMU